MGTGAQRVRLGFVVRGVAGLLRPLDGTPRRLGALPAFMKDPVRDGVALDSHAHAASVLLLGHTPELSVLAALTGQPF